MLTQPNLTKNMFCINSIKSNQTFDDIVCPTILEVKRRKDEKGFSFVPIAKGNTQQLQNHSKTFDGIFFSTIFVLHMNACLLFPLFLLF